MATCGKCGQRGQTVAHIRSCYAAAGVPVRQSSSSTQGEVPTNREAAPGQARKANASKQATRSSNSTSARKRTQGKKKRSRSRQSGTGVTRQVGAESLPDPTRMSEAEFRKKYPSGATKTPSSSSTGVKRSARTSNRNRGGANFRDGLVNPPPTGGIARSDY